MKDVVYYTIQTMPGSGQFLLQDDDAYLADDQLRETFDALVKQNKMGRLNEAPFDYYMRSELEGETEHYGADEIDPNLMQSAPLSYDSLGGNLYMISDPVLTVLSDTGTEHFIARRAILHHKASQRKWENFWFLAFTHSFRNKSQIKGDEPYFTELGGSPFYISEALKEKLTSLKLSGLDFTRHEWQCSS